MGRAVGITRKCLPFLTSNLFRQVVCSLVLCHLDYCSVVWSSASNVLLQKLQVAQNKAARLVLGCSYSTSVKDMHERLAWSMVKERLSASLLKFFHRVINTHTPTFFYRNITSCSEIHTHFTRAASDGLITFPLPKSNSMKRAAFYRSIMLWNSLPNELRNTREKACFKRKLCLLMHT